MGTGFIFHIDQSTAYVLTAAHVAHEDPFGYVAPGTQRTHTISRDAERTYPAELVYVSTTSSVDIASLKFACDDCKALAFSRTALLRVNQYDRLETPPGIEVVAITFPDLARGLDFSHGKTIPETHFRTPISISHDAYMIKGDSGSPLLNTDGYVIGINTGVNDAGSAIALYLGNPEANTRIHNTLRRAREDRRN